MSNDAPLIEPKRKLFFGLFIFPLVITVGMAVFLCAAVLMTHEQDTPENLLASLKKSAPSKRWQKAFELSNELNRNADKEPGDMVLKEMIGIFLDADRYDTKTRSYMAMALARSRTKNAQEALLSGIQDASEEVRVHSVWAITTSGNTEALPQIQALMKDDSEHVRKTAAYAMGALNCHNCVPDLQSALKDSASDVRWNAALALARLKNDSGLEILNDMLKRSELENELNMSEESIESVMTNALKGLGLIKNANSVKILESISKTDKNIHVRQAALAAMENFKEI